MEMRSVAVDALLKQGESSDKGFASSASGCDDFAERYDGEYALKRLLDLILSAFAMIVSAPLWVACAIAIRLEDVGPVFHVQQRWGKGRKPITVYKFRSMIVEADGSSQAQTNDSRVTRVGRLLRATSLDEMPQILNIWRGEMSWVGPRALPINEVQVNEPDNIPDDAIPGFDERCRVRPGLTGVAQIYAPRDVPRRNKFRYDRLYIRRQSLWLDLKLIALSLWITVRGRWEHRERKL